MADREFVDFATVKIFLRAQTAKENYLTSR